LELVQHIRDLLYHHDCVIVPGFGGFVTNERTARIDGSSNSFHPPSREVGFNSMLDHNDGLLISYLSARLSLNYVDAKKLTEAFAKEVTGRLEAGRSVSFEGIGRFSADRHHNLQFDPDPSANFMTDAYGLSYFRFPALAAAESARKRKLYHQNDQSELSAGVRKMLRYAAIVIPLIAAMTWGAMNTDVIREFNFEVSSLNPFSVVVDSAVTSKPANDRNTLHDSPVAETLSEMTTLKNALMYEEKSLTESMKEESVEEAVKADIPDIQTPSVQPVPQQLTPSHYLVAGSFKNFKNAMVLHDSLEIEGYNCEVFESEKGMFRVTVFSSEDSREALQMLRKLRAQEGNNGVWMLSI
jgi:nucleoid DNA-binding protein/cell division septation protein DedD